MRTLLAIIGAFALLAMAIFVGVFIYIGSRLEPATAEAAAYVDDAVASISESWDEAAFIEQAAPELMASVDAATRRRFLEFARRQYGAQLAYEPAAKCVLESFVLTFAGEVAIAHCASQGQFERGVLAFRVSVVKRRSEWRVFAFYVDLVGEQGPARDEPVIASVAPDAATLRVSSLEISLAGRYVAVNGPAAGAAVTGAGEDKIRALTKDEILARAGGAE